LQFASIEGPDTPQHEEHFTISSTSSPSSPPLASPSSYNPNSEYCKQLPDYFPQPNNNFQVINTLIRTMQNRDVRIQQQESRIAELTLQLSASEAKVCEPRKKHDEDYIKKRELWSQLSETETRLRKMSEEFGEKLRTSSDREILEGSTDSGT
jgi:hypothetical protein